MRDDRVLSLTDRGRAEAEQLLAARADELKNRFVYHPANSPERRQAHERVRESCLLTVEELVELTPPGREQALALTKLEEAMFWANAAIARQPGE